MGYLPFSAQMPYIYDLYYQANNSRLYDAYHL
jgi:hypothetical protein